MRNRLNQPLELRNQRGAVNKLAISAGVLALVAAYPLSHAYDLNQGLYKAVNSFTSENQSDAKSDNGLVRHSISFFEANFLDEDGGPKNRKRLSVERANCADFESQPSIGVS